MSDVDIVMNTRDVQRGLRAFDRDLEKSTRRLMAAESRQARDEIRGVWPVGPRKGGHSFRAVGSGTRGLRPVVRLRRDYRPYVGWLVFGGKRPRDRKARRVPSGGLWFYPTIERVRPRVVRASRKILDDAVRRAGLG